ncbi:MAG: tetraacyldisaccharide 4'-kinase [Candidatus Tritonobacter lacicola]|nr:tetraacyldisaccharide 4'-kinase [Candidatus Tritonobacter lacicola]
MTSIMISETNIVYPVGVSRLRDIIYRERMTVAGYLLLPVLWLLSLCYWVAAKARVFLFGKGILKSTRLNAYTLSVGNLTVGGTGKTPFVEKLAGDLYRKGGAVAILSRGYGRRRGGATLRVPSRPGSIAAVRGSGDEPAMLARSLPDVPVIVDSRRARGGEFAVSRCEARILVLDDGFSHLALKRDCDILLVDGEKGFRPGWVLPLGPLREPTGHLRRSDHIMLVGGTAESRSALAKRLVRDYGRRSIMEAVYKPSRLVSLANMKETRPLKVLREKRCIAFSGLASPARFEASVGQLGAKLLYSFRFPDHHWYDRDDIEMVTRRARNVGAEMILTTEKDSLKVPRSASLIPMYYLRIELKIVAGEEIYESILKEALKESTMTKPET